VNRRRRSRDRLHRAGQPCSSRVLMPRCATNCSTATSSTHCARRRSSSKAGGVTTTRATACLVGYRAPAPEVFVPALAPWRQDQP